MTITKTTRILTAACAAVRLRLPGCLPRSATRRARCSSRLAPSAASSRTLQARRPLPSENGVRGNRLGGIGSGLAYLGGDYFVALPDRGPNAVPFNPCTDDTVSYINRFHTMHLSLSPSDAGSTSLPFTLTPMVVATTLLSSRAPLTYGAGCGLVGGGEPALNEADHTHYFTGRSDNFDPLQTSTNPGNAQLDPEGIRVSNDLRRVYISDEYGPYIYEFNSFDWPPHARVHVAGEVCDLAAQRGRRSQDRRQYQRPCHQQGDGGTGDYARWLDTRRRHAEPVDPGRRRRQGRRRAHRDD